MLSTVARKNLMAASGLFLCVFLLVHVIGNAPLLVPEGRGREAFNRYAEVLSEFAPIRVASLLTFLAVALHALQALVLTQRARTAAGQRIRGAPRSALGGWPSRVMGATGLLVLAFLVLHLWDFWYPYQFLPAEVGTDAAGQRDLYGLVAGTLGHWAHAAAYVAGVLALGAHLHHGVAAASRSLGLYPPGLARRAHWVGVSFTAIVTIAFVAMTLVAFVQKG